MISLPILLLYSLMAISAINCLYYIFYSKYSISWRRRPKKDFDFPVSVIVYSKNEAERLPDFLAQFDKQTHKNYELVLVNNASTDDTRFIFEDFAENHANAVIVNVENNEAFWASRKYALTLGIKKATHENLLFTTTSVLFNSEDWITRNSNLLKKKIQIIVGHAYFEKKGGFTNLLIRFSEIMSNLQNYGTAAITKPYRASQANFGYTKSIFFNNNGYSNHMSTYEGAEDLFLKQNASTRNVRLATRPSNSVEKKMPESYSNWLDYKATQRKIAKQYTASNKFNFRLFGLSQFLFFVLATATLLINPSTIAFKIIGIRYGIAFFVFIITAIKLRDFKTIFLFPIGEIIYSFIQIPIFMRKIPTN